MSEIRIERYTVKQVAKLSGVSVRTLRFYDEIGLLKPAFYGENGYRYYEKEQLLLLQQILFYRELRFELSMIQKIVASPEFDKVRALKSHRDQLVKETERTEALIRTIDKTLAHLQKEAPMKEKEMYMGFDPKKQAELERDAIARWGEPAREKIAESKRRTKDWKKEDFEKVHRDYDELHRGFSAALASGLTADSKGVQELVRRHYAVVNCFWTPNRESYIGLGRTYCEHPDFRKIYDAYNPKLAEYLAEAMRIYAERSLK